MGSANDHGIDGGTPVHLYHPGVAAVITDPIAASSTGTGGTKRRQSNDGRKSSVKKRRKSQGDVDNQSGESVTPASSKESPASARGKKGQSNPPFSETLEIMPLKDMIPGGKETAKETEVSKRSPRVVSPTPTQPGSMPVSTVPISSGTTTTPLEVASNSQSLTEVTASPDMNQTSSPSRSRRQVCDSTVSPSPTKLSSPTRGRRSQVDHNVSVTSPEVHSQIAPSTNGDATTPVSVTPQTSTTETTDLYTCRRSGSNLHLDSSLEPASSTVSLNSPTSESFHSAEDDPNSPRKEKRHRDGSKKKKKDKDKDKEQRKKKHHHRDKHGMGEMASEMVTPVRIKVCWICFLFCLRFNEW